MEQNLKLNIGAYNTRGLRSSIADVRRITRGLDLLFLSET